MCGTSLALLIGLVGGALSSEVLWLAPNFNEGAGRPLLRRAVWWTTRALLAIPRAIHEMIWGLFLINILGLDPIVAVLAIALPFGAITSKVFGEIFDETPREACDALRASGASPLAAFLYGILPQAFPDLLSYAFYRFECAIRAAAVLGLIGAGGLGYQILLSLQSLQYGQIWTFLYALLLLGGFTDAWSSLLHRRLHLTNRIDLNIGRLAAKRPRSFTLNMDRDPVARASLLGAALLIPLSFWYIRADVARLFSGRALELLGGVLRDAWPPRLDPALMARLGPLSIETLAMSVLAIALAGAGGLLVSFPAATTFALPGGLLDAEEGQAPRAGRLRGVLVSASPAARCSSPGRSPRPSGPSSSSSSSSPASCPAPSPSASTTWASSAASWPRSTRTSTHVPCAPSRPRAPRRRRCSSTACSRGRCRAASPTCSIAGRCASGPRWSWAWSARAASAAS